MDKNVIGLSPKETSQLLQDDPRAVLIDIRSTPEFLFVGHPKGAIHVAWIDEPEWTVNPRFARDVREVLLGGIAQDEDAGFGPAPVILICRSGKRPVEAGAALIAGGFPRVHHVVEGFEGELDEDHHRSTRGGWRFHGLSWEQC